jgi:hypothetical protein
MRKKQLRAQKMLPPSLGVYPLTRASLKITGKGIANRPAQREISACKKCGLTPRRGKSFALRGHGF